MFGSSRKGMTVKYRIWALLTLLLIVFSASGSTQDNPYGIHIEELLFNRIPSDGQLHNPSYPKDTKEFAFTYSPELNRGFIFYDRTLLELDFTTSEWISTQFDSLPMQALRVGYSSFHNSLLIWDSGVGRVFQLDSTYTFTRIDNSFNQRAQYSHLQWIDQETGSVYAFGGYGLFESKNHLLRFSLESGIWELVELADWLDGPLHVIMGTAVYDDINQLIYLITNSISLREGNTGVGPKAGAALWRFSIRTKSWDKLLHLESPPTYWVDNSDLLKSTHSRLPVVMLPNTHGNYVVSPACFFHTKKVFMKCLESTQSSFFYNFGLKHMFWSERSQAYYLIGVESQIATNRYVFKIIKMTISDEQAFMQWLEKDEKPWYKRVTFWIILGVLTAGLLLIGLIYRRKLRGIIDSTFASEQDNITIVKSENGEFSLVGPTRSIDGILDTEQKLLSLLVDAYQVPDVYVKSDDIDMNLMPDHPSQDYIRRLRNLTLERLEGLFKSAGNESSTYILRRPTHSDKRKNEYRLNERYVSLRSEQ
jgi:hypothetical protein